MMDSKERHRIARIVAALYALRYASDAVMVAVNLAGFLPQSLYARFGEATPAIDRWFRATRDRLIAQLPREPSPPTQTFFFSGIPTSRPN